MEKPVEITFQGVEKSETIEAKVADKAAKLLRQFDRMTHMRVVIAAPHRHSHKGKIYQVKIEIGIPDRAPVVVTHDADVSDVQQDLSSAIRDAFEAARRQLEAASARLSGTAKVERGRRRPSPPNPG